LKKKRGQQTAEGPKKPNPDADAKTDALDTEDQPGGVGRVKREKKVNYRQPGESRQANNYSIGTETSLGTSKTRGDEDPFTGGDAQTQRQRKSSEIDRKSGRVGGEGKKLNHGVAGNARAEVLRTKIAPRQEVGRLQ